MVENTDFQPTPFLYAELQHELADAAYALNDLLNQYKMHTNNHPDDDLRVLVIEVMQARVNRYLTRAGKDQILYG